jgi:hypothetical protein
LISPPACPFGLARKRFVDVWRAAELEQAQFRCLEAFAANFFCDAYTAR